MKDVIKRSRMTRTQDFYRQRETDVFTVELNETAVSVSQTRCNDRRYRGVSPEHLARELADQIVEPLRRQLRDELAAHLRDADAEAERGRHGSRPVCSGACHPSDACF